MVRKAHRIEGPLVLRVILEPVEIVLLGAQARLKRTIKGVVWVRVSRAFEMVVKLCRNLHMSVAVGAQSERGVQKYLGVQL